IVNNTLTNASFAGVKGGLYGVYDQISRPDESADTDFINLDGNFVLTSQLKLDGQLGISHGHGRSPTQNVSETNPGTGAGGFWTLHGTTYGPDFGLPGVNYAQPFPPGNPQALTFGWIFGAQNVDTYDKETWAKLDATFSSADSGAWRDLKFGARYAKHDRNSLGSIAQGPTFAGPPNGGGVDPLNYPMSYSNYPSSFTTFGGNIPTGIWYWTPGQLALYDGPGMVQRDPIKRAYPPYWFGLSESNAAGYVQADFKGEQWAFNAGLRYVRTKEDTVQYIQPCAAFPGGFCPPNTPGLITGSLFGDFAAVPTSQTYNDLLPSANFRWEFTKEIIGRLAAAETMTLPDYSALSSSTSLSPPANVTCPGGVPCIGSGTASNPFLKPIRSNNFDAGLEWYFAPRSLLSATLFYMDLRNYVGYGTERLNYLTYGVKPTPTVGILVPYDLAVPVNTQGRAQGIELTYEQAFGNFGVEANYTYTDAKQTEFPPPLPGQPVAAQDTRLVGASKDTFNLSGYYENAHFSARVSYNYRSAFYSGLDRSTAFSQAGIGTLAASLAWIVTDNFSVNLDGQNLNDPTLKYYALNTDQPRAFYKNGRQYYLTVRAKF
ncbi:MAG: TonB-dependent receptor, partial [Gammaproteobacteria bacterium]|nr:TonB-dependent receptor [Gammaproteobacteria bacterium]